MTEPLSKTFRKMIDIIKHAEPAASRQAIERLNVARHMQAQNVTRKVDPWADGETEVLSPSWISSFASNSTNKNTVQGQRFQTPAQLWFMRAGQFGMDYRPIVLDGNQSEHFQVIDIDSFVNNSKRKTALSPLNT